jgi:hypothetical protein
MKERKAKEAKKMLDTGFKTAPTATDRDDDRGGFGSRAFHLATHHLNLSRFGQ